MNRLGNPLFLIMTLVLMLCSSVTTAAPVNTSDTVPELDNLTNYPSIERFEQGSVQVDFPSLESWPDFRFLKAWLPVEVTLNGEDKAHVGSAYVQATTDINFEQRTVAIADLKVLKTRSVFCKQMYSVNLKKTEQCESALRNSIRLSRSTLSF